jgi:antitoxin component YwqK of YwqJK toxin-antitoxin module
VGEIRDWKPHGYGKFYFDETLLYEGRFWRGKQHGRGKTYDMNGNLLYVGRLKASKYHGKGFHYREGRLTYAGNWQSGERCGFGKSFVYNVYQG